MSEVQNEREARTEARPTRGSRVRFVGPGLLLAATAIGAGDMITSLSAATSFGAALLWAIILGALIKFPLSEGVGRWYMASGQTMLEGWHSLGRPASWYFIIYLFIATFFTAGGLISISALAVNAMFPDVMPVWGWAMLHALFGFVLVGIGRYGLFERAMEILVVLMVGTVVVLALLLTPSLGELAPGLVPRLPEGSLLNVLAIIGGIGGIYSLVYYPSWANERGWRTSSWIPVMRMDVGVGYLVTVVFMVAMLIVGFEFLSGTGASISDEAGLAALSDPLGERFGGVAKWLFLIGFWSASTSSILGNWNGASHLFADFVRIRRNVPDEESESYREKSPYFRAFLVWITFPPIVLLAIGEPVLLVLVYTALGALFLPFLAITLIWLLNSRTVPQEHRNGFLSNVLLGAIAMFFVVFGVLTVMGLL